MQCCATHSTFVFSYCAEWETDALREEITLPQRRKWSLFLRSSDQPLDYTSKSQGTECILAPEMYPYMGMGRSTFSTVHTWTWSIDHITERTHLQNKISAYNPTTIHSLIVTLSDFSFWYNFTHTRCFFSVGFLTRTWNGKLWNWESQVILTYKHNKKTLTFSGI